MKNGFLALMNNWLYAETYLFIDKQNSRYHLKARNNSSNGKIKTSLGWFYLTREIDGRPPTHYHCNRLCSSGYLELILSIWRLYYTLFLFYKNVVFPAQVEYSYFSADLDGKYSCSIFKLKLMSFPFWHILGYQCTVHRNVIFS